MQKWKELTMICWLLITPPSLAQTQNTTNKPFFSNEMLIGIVGAVSGVVATSGFAWFGGRLKSGSIHEVVDQVQKALIPVQESLAEFDGTLRQLQTTIMQLDARQERDKALMEKELLSINTKLKEKYAYLEGNVKSNQIAIQKISEQLTDIKATLSFLTK